MTELWFGIVSVTLTIYVIMDGFDLGAGVLHLLVTRNNDERRRVIAAIGPYWDANEVWLIAAGGGLLIAFPKVMAAGLSGFYLAIFMVLWCLVLRGISIEFRNHAHAPLWRSFWDVVFAGASLLLCVFFGCAFGNLLRGLPVNADGWFSLSLFTDFSARMPVGILDWYTVLVGLYATLALVMHAGAFLCWKLDGEVQARCRAWAFRSGLLVTALWPVMTFFTVRVNPGLFEHFASRPLAWVCASLAFAGLAFLLLGLRRGTYGRAFLGSGTFLLGLMGATAVAMFPVMLRSVADPSWSITAYDAANEPAGLQIALRWWLIGIPLVIVYFVLQFRLHAGKTEIAENGHY
jgi:cytochrome d ubiquinol oxidase subunit II